MSAVDFQTQPVAPHQLQDNMALSSPSQSSAGDLQLNQQMMQLIAQLVEMMLQAMMQNMMKNQGGGQSSDEGNAFSGSKPSGCQGPQGGDPSGGVGAPQDVGAPQGAGVPQEAGAQQGAGSENPPAQASGSPPAPAAGVTDKPAAGPAEKPVGQSQEPAPATGSAASGKAPVGMPAEQWEGCVEAAQKTGVDPYVLAAQAKQESQYGSALGGSPSGGDGVMQVEPTTRQAYAAKFEARMGHSYDHGNVKDQIAMAAVIMADKGGSETNMLQKYNGGDNWAPGATDSYGRVILADQYAAKVSASAQELKASASA